MGARENITDSVRHLMVDHGMKAPELANRLGLTPRYMTRKLSEGRWTVDEIPVLARVFGVDEGDFFHGYQHIVSKKEKEKTDG